MSKFIDFFMMDVIGGFELSFGLSGYAFFVVTWYPEGNPVIDFEVLPFFGIDPVDWLPFADLALAILYAFRYDWPLGATFVFCLSFVESVMIVFASAFSFPKALAIFESSILKIESSVASLLSSLKLLLAGDMALELMVLFIVSSSMRTSLFN